MIYTDGVHLITDSNLEDLHRFAQSIGVCRQWFQNKHHPHYDIFGTTVEKAIKKGALSVSSRELVRILRKSQNNS